MSATEQEAPVEEQTIAGTVSGIVVKNSETWQISVKVDPTSQYSKNLWTKDKELVETMTSMIGQQVTFICRVSHWVRPDGQNVASLWINGWTTGGASGGQQEMQPIGDTVESESQKLMRMAREAEARERLEQEQISQAAAARDGQGGGTQTFVPQDVKELRIMREAADKCAGEVLAAMILTGVLKEDDLTPMRMHGFMDSFSSRRITFYETGSSAVDEDIPF